MKIVQYKKQLLILLHLIFWFISFNFWNVILNPGVESTNVIQGFVVEWDFILLINFLFLLYCSLPFIWIIRKAKRWIKISITILFLIPLVYAIMEKIKPDGNKDEVAGILEYFVKNFLYVLVFHFSIIAAVYVNLKVLITIFLNKSKFSLYLLYAVGLILLTASLNYLLFDFFIDQLFPSLYFILLFQDLGTRFNCGVLSDFHQCSIFDLAICPDAHCQTRSGAK